MALIQGPFIQRFKLELGPLLLQLICRAAPGGGGLYVFRRLKIRNPAVTFPLTVE